MSEPTPVTASLLKSMPLPVPADGADKNGRGRVLVIAGSAEVPGALLLAGEAAMRGGAGKLQLAGPQSATRGLGLLVPEARVIALAEKDGEIASADEVLRIAAKCDALLLGPGMLDEDRARELARRLLGEVDGPGFVIDAAAMMGLWDDPEPARRHRGRVVLTPHAGEMASLSGASKEDVEADPLKAAREAAERLDAVVAVKGKHTFVASPDGGAWVHHSQAVGLATSGSGDVLAGLITGLLARGASPEQATLWGIFLHGQAGVRLSAAVGPLGFLARELAGEIPALMAELSE
jgi:ADP-dependent NAD(P)H-hydrate dehydratase